MLGFFMNSAVAAPEKEYPRLSANQSASQDYEIVKLIDGPIDALYQYNNQSLFIAQSGDDLWKINSTGEVIDHFNTSDLYSSGLILATDGFIDWVFTGDKQQKSYGEIIDASSHSEQQLLDAFNNAEIVEFLDKNEKGLAYLYQNGKVEILDISNQRDKITDLVYMSHNIRTEYNIHQDETDINGNHFQSYNKKPGLFSFIKSEPSLPRYAAIKGYEKLTYHRPVGVVETLLENILGAIFVSNHSTREFGYEVGYSHVELTIKNQVLKFSVLSDEEFGPKRNHGITWLDPKFADAAGLKFMAVNYRRKYLAELNEKSLLPYYEEDVGLYVLRKKIPPNQSANAAWQLNYTGLHSYYPIWGYIEFSRADVTPAYYWLHKRRPTPAAAMTGDYGRKAEIASPILKMLPKSLAFNWQDFKDRNFRLVINNRDAWFYNADDTRIAITLEFDSDEIAQAFKQIGNVNETAQLNIDMVKKPYGAELIVYLKNTKKEVRLNKLRFDYQEQAFTPKSPQVSSDKNQTALFIAYEKSMLELNPNVFLKVLEEGAPKNEIVPYASSIGYYFARLAFQLNIDNKFTENVTLMNFYFDKIHSLINYNQTDDLQRKNLTIFASQVIYTGSNIQNTELTKKAISTFVEQDFDLEKETNRAFLFNVACYYALNHNKPQMLKIISRTLALGRDPESYLTDTDFQDYWQDPDFINLIKPVAVAP